jgi:hypothetical protein
VEEQNKASVLHANPETEEEAVQQTTSHAYIHAYIHAHTHHTCMNPHLYMHANPETRGRSSPTYTIAYIHTYIHTQHMHTYCITCMNPQ